MRVLIKLGGTLLDDACSRNRLAREITELIKSGIDVSVVHGGGKQMTRFLSERGIESRFVEGLRVTTPEIVDAVLKVFCGTINHELVAAFQAAGAEAVGLSGIDAGLAEAEPLREELGAVGRVVRTNGAVLEALTGGGFLPVVACVAGDRSGRIYNVNADLMAVACAAAYRADHLIFLTDVEGVKGASGGVLPSLSAADCADLIATGIATGGMQAKLNAATDALQAGVRQVTIAPGAVENAAARVLRGEPIGTRLHSGVAAKPIQEEKVDA